VRYVRGKITVDPVKNAPEVFRYMNGEFMKLELTLKLPEVFGLQFEVLGTVPAKFREGDLYYGASGVFGAQAGLYIRDANSWRKL